MNYCNKSGKLCRLLRPDPIIFFICFVFFKSNIYSFIYYKINTSPAGLPLEYLSSFTLNARAGGLANAYTANTSDVSCSYWNPAGISKIYYNEISILSAPLFFDTQFIGLSFGYPLGEKKVIGLSIIRLTSGAAERTNSIGESLGYTFRQTQSAYLMTYALNFSSEISAGMNIKFISENMDTNWSQMYNLDLGIILTKSNNTGISLQNILPGKFGKDNINPDLKIGLIHNFKKIYIFTDFSLLSIGNWNLFRWAIGFEHNTFKNFFFRSGLNHRELTLGVGLLSEKINFDYAISFNQIEPVSKISLNFKYGFILTEHEKNIEEQKKQFKIEKEKFEEQQKIATQQLEQEKEKIKLQEWISTQLSIARNYFDSKDYIKAGEILKQILQKDDTHQSAKILNEEINNKINTENIEKKYFEAYSYYLKKDYPTSLEKTKEILSLNSGHKASQILLFLSQAQIFIQEKKLNDAKGELIEILKIAPEHKESVTLLKRIQTLLDIETK